LFLSCLPYDFPPNAENVKKSSSSSSKNYAKGSLPPKKFLNMSSALSKVKTPPWLSNPLNEPPVDPPPVAIKGSR
jgi:hypothetical protein